MAAPAPAFDERTQPVSWALALLDDYDHQREPGHSRVVLHMRLTGLPRVRILRPLVAVSLSRWFRLYAPPFVPLHLSLNADGFGGFSSIRFINFRWVQHNNEPWRERMDIATVRDFVRDDTLAHVLLYETLLQHRVPRDLAGIVVAYAVHA